NRALEILEVQDKKDGTIAVVYRALKRLDWLGTAYQGTLRESADIMVDFYDAQGLLISSTPYPARRTSVGDKDVMNPGELGLLKVQKPLSAQSHRIWLVK
ncbi:MAG: hypothetical protein ACT4OO_08440, partial [Nitrospiraceae bacterium]